MKIEPAPEAGKLPSEETVFDVQPQLGAKTSEPSLREIIYGYYAQHFSAPEAADLEQQYIAALLSPAQPHDVPAGDGDERRYPCAKCGLLRSKAEGGTTFTVCDTCWDDEPARSTSGRA